MIKVMNSWPALFLLNVRVLMPLKSHCANGLIFVKFHKAKSSRVAVVWKLREWDAAQVSPPDRGSKLRQ
ncbi:hypothetical protein TNCV_988021 [Trichonephila clavipes]|nr:hypothetical protein TNCV_988021 [Trichonephila clavipes]